MIIDSAIVTGMAAALTPVRPEAGDSEIRIPSVLLPTQDFRKTLNPRFSAGPGALEVLDSSFSFSSNPTRANAGDLAAAMGVLAVGFWEIYYQAVIFANFTAGGLAHSLALDYFNSEFFFFYQLPTITGARAQGRLKFALHQNARLTQFTTGNGVGETTTHYLTFAFSRLA